MTGDIRQARAHVARVLDGISYRPGSVFSVRVLPNRHAVRIYLYGEVVDTYDPTRTVKLRSWVTLPAGHFTEAAIVKAVHGMVVGRETHEAQEWLVVNGRRPFDPHVKR